MAEVHFTFVEDNGNVAEIPIHPNFLRDLRIKAIFEGMKIAGMPYTERIIRLAQMNNLSDRRIETLISTSYPKRKKG